MVLLVRRQDFVVLGGFQRLLLGQLRRDL